MSVQMWLITKRDLEIDTIIGKNHKGAILTINDRLTGRVWIRKLQGKEAIPVAKVTAWALRKVKELNLYYYG